MIVSRIYVTLEVKEVNFGEPEHTEKTKHCVIHGLDPDQVARQCLMILDYAAQVRRNEILRDDPPETEDIPL